MIVDRIEISPNYFGPDIPEGTEYKSAILNPDGETYTLTGVEYINGVPVTITSFQGKEHLRNIGKYDEVVTILNEMVENNHPLGNTYKNAFDNIQNWQRSSVTIQNMAGSIGIVGTGLDNFFIEAKKIELP